MKRTKKKTRNNTNDGEDSHHEVTAKISSFHQLNPYAGGGQFGQYKIMQKSSKMMAHRLSSESIQ